MSFLARLSARLKMSTHFAGLLIAAAIAFSAPYGFAVLSRSGLVCTLLAKAGAFFS